ncbi:GNAT family N-acetyltransferase [Enterovibrio coralii]|uniref:GNAT family N-acetyltransferase n=1 Tax=Enterovibrio coralii TaxID=294935 RepID=UPI000AA87998|nr:GNAT family N-acetyltransferase [Enterovibrio coralii]
MHTDPVSALLALKEQAIQYKVRFPVFIEGDEAFCQQILIALPESTKVSDKVEDDTTLPWSKAKQLLGQELGTLVLDIRETTDVDKICAFSGCVKGGELLLLLVAKSELPFSQRLSRFWKHTNAACISQYSGISMPQSAIKAHDMAHFCEGVTTDQHAALEAIHKVLSGHRRRPLLLVADRGRGKSSALGLAAGSIIQSSKKRILVCSPSIANAETVFTHAATKDGIERLSKYHLSSPVGGEIRFVAPDALLRDAPDCDLLLVDEAAAIPMPMLERMIEQYSRVVFSSTEHGYEGTGRAFSARFRHLLSDKANGWKECRLEMPVRWATNDPLEAWLFDTFLFDAEPVLPPEEGALSYQQISSDQLLQDEALLRQLFALLVTAHYQTSPNDLVQLLNAKEQLIIGAFKGEVLVGATLGLKEGGFDTSLATDVVLGKRRLKGHLLAQSLASHSGVIDALVAPLLRIVRIAVHPELRRQGVGREMISAIEVLAKNCNINVIGTSFGCTLPLLDFWLSQAYLPARLGVQRDAASGSYSLQMVKPLTRSAKWINDLSALFSVNFLHQLSEQFADMDTMLLNKLVSVSCQTPNPNTLVVLKSRFLPMVRWVMTWSWEVFGNGLLIGLKEIRVTMTQTIKAAH